jgi:hypothetical protein
MQQLKWSKDGVLQRKLLPSYPCFEATVPGGKYRVAPAAVGKSRKKFAGYSLIFVPTNTWSMRNVGDGYATAEEAKAAAAADANEPAARRPIKGGNK